MHNKALIEYGKFENRLIRVLFIAGLSIFVCFGTSACGSLPENTEQNPSQAISSELTTQSELGLAAKNFSSQHKDQNGSYLLLSGLDAFVARGVLAQKAQQTLDVQYYLFHNDDTGLSLGKLLREAADRGVRVRILGDDMDLANRDLGIAGMNNHPNIEIRIFNPFARDGSRLLQMVSGFGDVTRRMHNKSFIADNQFAIVGGRNIGDEYFDVNPDTAFADLDVLLLGPVVPKISDAFDLYWNSSLAFPVETVIGVDTDQEELEKHDARIAQQLAEFNDSPYLTALANSDLTKDLKDGALNFYWSDQVDVYYDNPIKLEADRDALHFQMRQQIRPIIENAQRELTIISPYFVPGETGTELLQGIAKRGVKIRILTNSLASNDVAAVHAGYKKYRKPLLEAGIELYEMQKPLEEEDESGEPIERRFGTSHSSLHAKTFTVDREKIFIGSMNLDPRSFIENTEIGVVIHSPELSNDFTDYFDARIDHSAFKLDLVDGDLVWKGYEDNKPVTYHKEPYTSWWDRFVVGFIGLFPIESQL